MVALELEVLAKKFDRFGWEADRGSPAHDRIVTDWMDALQDFLLDEVKAACRAAVLSSPRRMPNEGAIVAEVMKIRATKARRFKAITPATECNQPAPRGNRKAEAEAIMAGFRND